MKRIVLAASVVFAAAASPAAAEKGATTFDCEMKRFTNNGWIPPRVIVTLAEGEESAQVYDGIIHEVIGKPIPADITPRNETMVNLGWHVKGIPVSNLGGTAEVQYFGVLNMAKQTLSVRGIVSGFVNQPRARGNCKVKRG